MTQQFEPSAAEDPRAIDEPEGAAEGTPESEERTGLFERLAQRREAIGDPTSTLDLDIPGYNGELFARYGVLEGGWDVVEKMTQKYSKSRNPRKTLLLACDLLVRCCTGLYVRTSTGDILTLEGAPESELGADPPSFRNPDRVGRVLRFKYDDRTTARQCVLRVFNNELAINRQYIELSNWLEDRSQEDDDEFLGESEGSPR